MPIPSIVRIRPRIVHLGWTQLKELGLTRPKRHPKATQTGNAVDKASPTTSIQPWRPLPPLSLSMKCRSEMEQEKRVTRLFLLKWAQWVLWKGIHLLVVVVAIVMLIWLDVKTKTNWMDRRRKCVMRWEMVDWVFWDLGFGVWVWSKVETPSSMRNWEWRLHHLSLSLLCFSHFHLCYRL